MTKKLTSKDLLGLLIDLEQDLEFCNETENSIEVLNKITEVKGMISKKVDSIDYFSVELDRQTGLIDAEIDTYRKEVKRLQVRRMLSKGQMIT